MVHATSRPLRDAAARALFGMRLRKKCTVVQMEYDLDSACGTCNGTSTDDSEAMPFPEECAFVPELHQAARAYGGDPPAPRREELLLCAAAAFLVLGHWQQILWALSTLSLPQVSRIAAVACVLAAAWLHAASHFKGWVTHVQDACDQVVCIVKSLIDAILELPGCHRTITLALRELEEVDYTLKNIHAKIRFLPGTYEKKVTLTTCTEGIQAFPEA